MKSLNVYNLGLISYKDALAKQEELQKKRINNEIEDCLLVLEHPPTITTGRKGNTQNLIINEDFLKKNNIHFQVTGRGGDITFHGPGQIVCYPIIDLGIHGKNVHKYIRNLEETIILSLSDFGITGRRIEKLTGVWVKRSKIASIGVGIKRWVTYHGFALNVNTNMDYFDLIVPCGIQDVRMTSIKTLLALNKEVDLLKVNESIIKNFKNVFKFDKIINSYLN